MFVKTQMLGAETMVPWVKSKEASKLEEARTGEIIRFFAFHPARHLYAQPVRDVALSKASMARVLWLCTFLWFLALVWLARPTCDLSGGHVCQAGPGNSSASSSSWAGDSAAGEQHVTADDFFTRRFQDTKCSFAFVLV